ncbi:MULTISPECIES: flagellar hook-associated protein FlgL [unclassified Pseudomonas]|uniref:flagellar hook-associated protein FlgL n=1 Tax=unclassified Pseudomonas TaxID=196821 RepID=UPI0012F4709C|nr:MULTISPECIES: flagellar hook-associated protein FlgL [unclassified Pseudomonas]VXC27738.1 Flagellar hook-associated protein 3 [Pseudomonas sp. 8O]
MRISSIQAFNNGVQGLQRNYADVTRTQQQISTGNRILTPADDPVASVRLLQLEQQQNVLSQYKSNLVAADNSLTQEEVTLASAHTILQRLQELTVRAGNGSLGELERQSIAAELKEREEELFALMNTRNARGEYIFSGFQGKTQAFGRDDSGNYSYQGDEGQRRLQIGSSLDIPISDNGKRIFENIINADRLDRTLDVSAAPGSTLSVSAPLVQSEVAFTGNPPFPDAGIEIVFGNPDAQSYEIFEAGTTTPVLGSGQLDDDPDEADQVTFRGVTLQVDGAAVGGERVTVTLDPTRQKQGVLDTIVNLRRVLENPASTSSEIRDAVAAGMTNLDHAAVNIDSVRGEIGARLNVIDTTLTDNEDVTLVNKSVQADLRELDYAEALSRLSFQSIILEAAQQSYVKISSLNLFNKL